MSSCCQGLLAFFLSTMALLGIATYLRIKLDQARKQLRELTKDKNAD